MRIAYNPLYKPDGKTKVGALTSAPINDIVFDLPGKSIWAKGLKFLGTDSLKIIIGSSSDTVAGTWTGQHSEIDRYEDGLTIIYIPKVAGASTTTLNINGLGAKTCYYSGNSKLTTHYPAGTPILFTYYNDGWRRADYDSNTNYYRPIEVNDTTLLGNNNYVLNFKSDGNISYVTTTATSTSKQADLTIGINILTLKNNLGVSTIINNASTNDLLPTSKSVYDFVGTYLTSYMHWKGNTPSSGTTFTIPNAAVIGDAYRIAVSGTIPAANSITGSAQVVEVGDIIICTDATGPKYTVAQTNWTTVAGTSALAWNSEVTLATIGGLAIKAKLPTNPTLALKSISFTKADGTAVSYNGSSAVDLTGGINYATLANLVRNNLIIKWGDTEGTNLFTYNGSTEKTINLSTPFSLLFTNFSNAGSLTTRITIGGVTKDLKIDADLLDGKHAGVQNGQVSIYVAFPHNSRLVSLGYNILANLINTEEYLKGICKWAIDNYSGNGDCTLIGACCPNSSGTLILHLYSNNGKDSTTGLPRYCEGIFFHMSGNAHTFGTLDYVWKWAHSTWNGNALTAHKWTTARTLTIGNTGKSVDGSGNVSWSLAEIGVSAAAHTHSVKINGATKIIAASNGAAVDLGNYLPLSGGTMSGSIILKGSTSPDMTYGGNVHPYIRFDNANSNQNVSLIFTDHDTYRSPAGIKLIGNQGGEWFEAPNIYATNFYGVLKGNADSATKLTSSAGSATLPIYFSDGKPISCTPASLFSNLSNSGNDISITVAGLNRTLTVNYATSATTATALLTNNTSQSADACYSGNPGLRFWRFNGTGNNIGGGDGWIMSWSWNPGSVGGQIYFDDNPSKIVAIRGYKNDTKTFTSWSKFIHSDNYNSYSPKLDGTGASGTWNININGNAATATNAQNIRIDQYASTGDYPVIWANVASSNSNNNTISRLYKTWKYLYWTPNKKTLTLAGNGTKCAIGSAFDTVDRPGLHITGNYPELIMMSLNVSNANHGSTIVLGAYNSSSDSETNYRAFAIGMSGTTTNEAFLDFGYGANMPNPHSNGIANYGNNSYNNPYIMRLTASKRVFIQGVGNNSLPVLLVSASRNGRWSYAAAFMAPNTGTGNNVYVPIGKALSTRNCFGFTHEHAGGDGSAANYGAVEVYGVGNLLRWYYDKHTLFFGRVDVANNANDASYMHSALQIREYNYGGSQSDTWAIAPRLSWHWSGRVLAQIGLASNNELYLSKDSFSHSYKLVYENPDILWSINVDKLDGYHTSNISSPAFHFALGTIDLTEAAGFDRNTYYPCTIGAAYYLKLRIHIWGELSSNTPSVFTTHGSGGFAMMLDWETNACGWGAISIQRKIHLWSYSWISVNPCAGIGQLSNSSVEYVYLRGGAKYRYWTSTASTITPLKTTYTVSSLSVSPTTSVSSPINARSKSLESVSYLYCSEIQCSGNSYAAHFYENSDIRYKLILNNLSITTKEISELPLFDFEWIENNSIGTGTSAQSVQEILPNIVSGTDKLTLDYGVLGTIAGITACKELVNLKSEIDLLKERIELLELQLKMINDYGRC